MHHLFQKLTEVDQEVQGIFWTVITSRRTPQNCYPAIEAFARNAGACDLVDYRNAGAGSLSRSFDSDAALVTQDSMTMVSEFRTNNYPTAVLAVPRPGGTWDDYHDSLRKSGEIPFLKPDDLTAERLETALRSIVVGTEDIYARLRAIISRRIPDLFD